MTKSCDLPYPSWCDDFLIIVDQIDPVILIVGLNPDVLVAVVGHIDNAIVKSGVS